MLFDINNDIGENVNLYFSLPKKNFTTSVSFLDSYLSKVKSPRWQPDFS